MKNNNGAAVRRLSARSLKNNRMRNLFMIMAVVLTGMLFTAVFSLMSGIIQVTQESAMREVGGRFHAGLKAATKEQYEKIIQDPLIKESGYTILIGIADNIIKRPTELRCLQEESWLKDLFITLEEGHLPVERNEILVDTFVLDELGLPHALGEKIPVSFSFLGKEVKEEFVVSGYYQGDYVAHASEVFLSEKYWEELKGSLTDEDFLKWKELHPEDAGAGLMAVNFFFYDESELEEKIRTVIRNAGYEPETELDYGVNWAYMSSRMESADPFAVILLMSVIVIILVTGYLIIYNIFQISVISDIRFYGLLKTIGTTKQQIRRLIRRQAAILSAVGIPIGLIIGYGIGKLILPFSMEYTGYEGIDAELKLNPHIFVFSALFSVFTVFISCRKPGKIAGNVSPIEAVKYTGMGEGKKNGKKPGVEKDRQQKIYDRGVGRRRRHLGIISMAIANMGRNKRSTVTVIAAISFSIGLLVLIITAVSSFSPDQYLKQRIAGDYLLGHINIISSPRDGEVAIDPAYLALADAQEGIESRSEMWVCYGSRLLVDEKAREQYRKLDAEGKLKRTVYDEGLPDRLLGGEEDNMGGFFYGYSEELLQNLKVLEGTLDMEKFMSGNYILLDTLRGEEQLSARDHVYHPGDKVMVEHIAEDSTFYEVKNEAGETVSIRYENMASKEYEVMAIVEIPFSMNLHRYTRNGCDVILPLQEITERGELFAVSYQVKDGYQKAFESAVREYSDAYPKMGYASKESVRKEFESMMTVVAVLGITLCAVIALIGILNFINAMVTEIISGKREFAMLQSIGMTDEQLKKMLIWEGISYVGISGMIALLVGAPLSWIVLKAVNQVVLFFEYHFRFLPFVIMLPELAVVAVLTPVLAYRNMKKKSIVERLREAG